MAALMQCRENENHPAQGEVRFIFSPPLASRVGTGIHDKTDIIISISEEIGNNYPYLQEIRVTNTGAEYISDPLALQPGRYFIHDFLIAVNDDIMCATPKTGSDLAPIVDQSLPYSFDIVQGEIRTVAIEVMDITHLIPEALGYESFGKNAIHPLNIAVFEEKNGRLKNTKAVLHLESADSVIFHAGLQPRENILSFPADVNVDYTLRIVKEGFRDFTMDFNYSQYRREFGADPINIVLEEENIFEFSTSYDPELYLTFLKSGAVTVHWPNGDTETISFSADPADPDKFSYHYLNAVLPDTLNSIRLTGDVQRIVELVVLSPVEFLNVFQLTNLQNLTIENSALPKLDLRKNKQLITLSFINMHPGELRLPLDHEIENVLVEGSVAEELDFPMDELIMNIYQNTIRKDIREGAFILFNAGDISPSSRDQLRTLEDAYSWYVEIE
jgi:hypothetical protein